MRSFTCFYGHGQGLGRAHGHGQGHGRAHGFLLCFYDDFYRYVAGQVSLAKSVPPYNYALKIAAPQTSELCFATEFRPWKSDRT